MPRKITHESFVERLRQINPAIEVLGTYAGSAVKVACRCGTCGNEWEARPANLLAGRGCPLCASSRRGQGARDAGLEPSATPSAGSAADAGPAAAVAAVGTAAADAAPVPVEQPSARRAPESSAFVRPTNREKFFGTDDRIAATLKHISLCCNETKCEECPLEQICCQPPIKFLEWLSEEPAA